MPLNFLVLPDLGSWLEWAQTAMPNRPTHLMRALQRREEIRKIMVVEPPYPMLKSARDPARYRLRSGKVIWGYLGASLRQAEEKIFVLELPAVPPSKLKVTHGFTRWLTDWLTLGAIEALSLRPFVLLLGVPHNHRLICRFGEVLSVFDESGANWLTWCGPSEQATIEAAYHAICQKADVIFVATESMKNYLGKNSDAVYLLPNGVDCLAFQDGVLDSPKDLLALPRPWLGYVGTLGERMDLSILQALASGFPSGSIVLIGPMPESESHFVSLREKSNIYFLGRRPYQDVSRYMAHFDVCLIPHKLSDMTLSQSPMKFYEYLATGKPIVSTRVPPAPEFQDLIYLADTPGGFAKAVAAALCENGSGLLRARQERARRESWDVRVDALLSIIHRHLH